MVQPTKVMLVDTSSIEETRIAVADANNCLINFDFEKKTKRTIKGHIFLAKITRIEPALQAAFIDYGESRHGFLSFDEVHPDYFRIPMADRRDLVLNPEKGQESYLEGSSSFTNEEFSLKEGKIKQNQRSLHSLYKIQEVLQKNQVILVQVLKEERSGKGAVLSTYLSLAGRYCVLMPNSPSSKGVSRRISDHKERSKLQKIIKEIDLPVEMGLIIRTAGRRQTKTEIKRDAEHLMRVWNETRGLTLQSVAPTLVYEDDDILKRAIRDYYTKDVKEILVSGDEGYKKTKYFMKSLIPSHVRRVHRYKEIETSLFTKHKVESQIDAMYEPEVHLPSGGSIIIQQTEALVSIDINSGKSTRDRHIEETALHTNLEAADEITRQVFLRNLAGLLVIDFIDMENTKHISQVERRVREGFRNDRARVRIGRISPLCLLEISRQRLRPSILEMTSQPCPYCHASGFIRSKESISSMILHLLEEECLKKVHVEIQIVVPMEVAFYLLNVKKSSLKRLEKFYSVQIEVLGDSNLFIPNYVLNSVKGKSNLLQKREFKSQEAFL